MEVWIGVKKLRTINPLYFTVNWTWEKGKDSLDRDILICPELVSQNRHHESRRSEIDERV